MANAFWEDIRTYWEKAMSEDISNSMLWAAKADNCIEDGLYEDKLRVYGLAKRVDANSLKLQMAVTQAGLMNAGCVSVSEYGSIVAKQMSDQNENALNRRNQELCSLALAYSNQQTEINKLKAERDKLLAERAAINDALAGACKSQPYQSRETRNISRAIGNTDFGNSKLGLPLHDRY